MAKIFLSHSHKDFRLVSRLHDFIKWSSGGAFEVYRSSKDGAIKTGENWYDWIDKRILECDIAVVVLTPSSFRGKWVLWEAGAVAGVQRERLNQKTIQGNERKVRALVFDVGTIDLGPFGREQIVDGLDEGQIAEFMQELLDDFECVKSADYKAALRGLEQKTKEFVNGAKSDLRFTPFFVSEGLVKEWLNRISEANKKNDYSWIVAAQRWINIAFLGAGNAESTSPIDFRIHSALALCHEQEQRWDRAAKQLKLAAELSPNDLPILMRYGRALLSNNEDDKVKFLLNSIKELDNRIYNEDREAITLYCRYLVQNKNWIQVNKLLESVSPELISNDEYLCTWNALSSMQVDSTDESLKRFRQLKKLFETKTNFWSYAALVNAHLALKENEEASEILKKMELSKRKANEIESATKYFDEILKKYGNSFNWHIPAGLSD